MNSRPLFMSVAESTEILRPMTQFGCAQASRASRGRAARDRVSRNGPPDAVSRMRFTPGGATPLRRVARQALEYRVVFAVDRQQRRARRRARVCMSSGPAITSDSLLANNRRLPARAAANVERRPAAPTIAAMTLCTSGRLAMFDERDRRRR